MSKERREFFKVEWVKALRSGRYPESRRIRRNMRHLDGTWSAIGVLANIMGARWYQKGNAYPRGDVVCWVAESPLDTPAGVSEAFGGGLREVIDMDCGYGNYAGNPQTFAQIADWIEENL